MFWQSNASGITESCYCRRVRDFLPQWFQADVEVPWTELDAIFKQLHSILHCHQL